MKITTLFLSIFVLFAAVSCDQNPVFFSIFEEIPPQDPFIEGTPSNMVVFERIYPDPEYPDDPLKNITVPILYVGSDTINWYAKRNYGRPFPQNMEPGSSWNASIYWIPHPQPGGRIIQLAATNDHLYALSLLIKTNTFTVHRIGKDSDSNWKYVTSSNSRIQTIFADPAGEGRIFAGASGSGSNFDILYLDNSNPDSPVLRELRTGTSLLSGAVFKGGSHYLSTRGSGIFQVSETVLSAGGSIDESDVLHLADESENNNHLFMGMIKLEDTTILAIERNGGTFYKVDINLYQQIKIEDSDTETIRTGDFATGALALWQSTSPNPLTNMPDKKLIAGKQGNLFSASSVLNGYMEFDLDPTGSLDMEKRGSDPENVSSIGLIPINHLFQVPKDVDVNMIFFASTQNRGLWSLREISPQRWRWNAESD